MNYYAMVAPIAIYVIWVMIKIVNVQIKFKISNNYNPKESQQHTHHNCAFQSRYQLLVNLSLTHAPRLCLRQTLQCLCITFKCHQGIYYVFIVIW